MRHYLSSIQVVCNLQHQEKNSEGLLLNRVSQPVFYNGPTQRQQWMHLAQLSLHQQQLQSHKQHVTKLHGEKATQIKWKVPFNSRDGFQLTIPLLSKNRALQGEKRTCCEIVSVIPQTDVRSLSVLNLICTPCVL